MKNQMLHTPDGVRDLYNTECSQKLLLQDRLHRVHLSYGYQDIQTPTFEFFNVFGNEVGTTPSRDLYKFFDKEGNTLVLRPDFTPSIARSAATYYSEDLLPVKLCYMGNTFINSSDYQGRAKETTQCGVELIGDNSVAADAEILAMAVEALLSGGLKEFQISVGHANFFKSLVRAANLDEEREEELKNLIENKNFLGVEEFVEMLAISPALRRLFLMLGSFETGDEELEAAKRDAEGYPEILTSIEELLELGRFLKIYQIDKYVTFELGILSNYRYYTGIIFLGYTYGTGEPILKGGRYDGLLKYFGKDASAIGYAIVVDQLLASLSRQKIALVGPQENILIVYDEPHSERAILAAREHRKKGSNVRLIPENPPMVRSDYEDYAKKNHFASIVFFSDENGTPASET